MSKKFETTESKVLSEKKQISFVHIVGAKGK